MATPNTTTSIDFHAKNFFNRMASVAVRMGVCISCQKSSKKKDFVAAGFGDQFEEYKTDGLCFRCNGELSRAA